MTEDELDLLDAGPSRDERGGIEVPQVVRHHVRQAADPADSWRRAETALRTARTILDSDDDAVAQGHLDALGDTLHNLARATPGSHQTELQAAARVFNRARRSAVRADHQAATGLRQAAKELAYAPNIPGGLAIAVVFAALHLARAAAKWHEQRGHEQQAAAAEETFRHLQQGYRQAAEPVLADLCRHAPGPQTAERFKDTVRQAIPDHADRILADPAWPALTTTLARAETAGHNPRHLLVDVAARRELDSAEHPAEVLNWRIAIQPNKRRAAATLRSSPTRGNYRATAPTATTPPIANGHRQGHRR